LRNNRVKLVILLTASGMAASVAGQTNLLPGVVATTIAVILGTVELSAIAIGFEVVAYVEGTSSVAYASSGEVAEES